MTLSGYEQANTAPTRSKPDIFDHAAEPYLAQPRTLGSFVVCWAVDTVLHVIIHPLEPQRRQSGQTLLART
jgi:hypothetical protein